MPSGWEELPDHPRAGIVESGLLIAREVREPRLRRQPRPGEQIHAKRHVILPPEHRAAGREDDSHRPERCGAIVLDRLRLRS